MATTDPQAVSKSSKAATSKPKAKLTAKKPTRKNHAAPAAKKSAVKKAVANTAATKAPPKGALVEWAWGANRAVGKVLQVFTDTISKTLKGTKVTRKASPKKPAVLVKTGKGDEVLKSASEVKVLRKASTKPL